ncbi:GntP family permease [Agathobaculum sp. LCP25S3_E8]|uniref:GntP family permease n=1 Tax=Agathobaculum sp. LCP25S3_E8 TaxID=3438735 RepID=UPI003F91C9AA
MILLWFVISIALLILMISKLKVHAFLTLLIISLFFGVCAGIPIHELPTLIASGFGNTMTSIGIVIVCGVVIGTFLEYTGGAQKIADAILKLIGIKRATYATSITGAFVSIPVFCDSGFVILNPIIKGLSRRGRISYASLVVALMAGLLCTHSFIPPTPGPVAAAGLYGAEIGQVMFYGLIVSILVVIVCSIWANSRFVKGAFPEVAAENELDAEQEKEFQKVVEHAPSTFMSFIPVALPIVIIILKSFFGNAEGNMLQRILDVVGTPWVALLIGTAICFLLPTKLNETVTNEWVAKSLSGAAEIMCITAAAGGFAAVLQATTIGDTLANLVLDAGLPAVFVPYLMAALINLAQGSATVALTTVGGILAPMLPALGLNPIVATLATAAGSLSFCHTNSSYFWCVTKLGNLKLNQSYRLITLTSVMMGLTAMVVICILNLFL